MRPAFGLPLSIILAILQSPVQAATWQVPSECPTIQAGIDSASAGDTVLVACGTYDEHNIVMKAGVWVRGETGDPGCVVVLPRPYAGPVFQCDSLDCAAAIEALTIAGGVADWGGGLFCRHTSLRLADVVFRSNVAGHQGGAIYCCYGSDLSIVDCEFLLNRVPGGMGPIGGAVYVSSGSTVTLSACAFSENYAYLDGGALLCRDCSVNATECIFAGNATEDVGGAVCCEGVSSSAFTCCAFSGNSSWGGGAVWCWGCPLTVAGCVFSDNRAHWGGGGGLEGRYCHSLTLIDCVFLRNVSTGSGGGGAIDARGSTLLLDGCTFWGNSASQGGGLRLIESADAALSNTIVASCSQGEGIHCASNSSAALVCSDLYGNAGGDWVGPIADQHGVDGNFSACPLFCDPENADFHLQECSPCAPGNHPQGYDCGLIGAWDVACGCGMPSAVESTTWSSLKARYR